MSETKGDYYPRKAALLQEEEIQRLQVKVNMLESENVELKSKLARYEQGQPMETAPRDGTEILIEGPAGCYDICSCSYHYYDLWIVASSGDIISFENAIRWWPLPGGAK